MQTAMTSASTATASAFSTRTLLHLVAGGIVGLIAWEVIARAITPFVVGGPLEPPALIVSLFKNTLGATLPWSLAYLLHIVTGLVLYPLIYWATTRPLPLQRGTIGGIVLGVLTWILALGVFASLAGLPFMLGFIPLTWMSLVGHVALGLGTAWTFEALEERAA